MFSKGMERKRQVLPDNVSSIPGKPSGNTEFLYLTTLVLQRTTGIATAYSSVRHRH